MNGKLLLFAFAIALLGVLVQRPLVVAKSVDRFIHDTVALRVDSVRVEVRPAGFGLCALPAVVTAVLRGHHDEIDGEPMVHGHYTVAAGMTNLNVVALPADAHTGDVVCVMRMI